MRVIMIYDDEREVIATNVSTCGLQRQSNKGKLRSNKTAKSSTLYIEHFNSHDRTFLVLVEVFSVDAVKNSDYYKKACGYGKVCQKN